MTPAAYLPIVKQAAGRLFARIQNTAAAKVVTLEDLVQEGAIAAHVAQGRLAGADDLRAWKYTHLRVRGAMVDFLRTVAWMPHSIRPDDRIELQDMQEGDDETIPSHEDVERCAMQRELIERAIECLPPRELEIVSMLAEGSSQIEIAAALCVHESRVSQILVRARRRMKVAGVV